MRDRIYLVLLGVPGAGKGTQSQFLQEKLGIPKVATGDIFRYNLKNETQLGLLAKSYMDRGELVPDEVTLRMVEDRLSQADAAQGVILDGFPRTLVQAQALDEMIAEFGGVSLVPMIELEDDEATMRLTGRRVCLNNCGMTYHLVFNPTSGETCDNCGGTLYQRDDDKPETVRHRLYIYYKQTAPLIGYYFAKGLLAAIDGAKPIEDVQAQLVEWLVEKMIVSAEDFLPV